MFNSALVFVGLWEFDIDRRVLQVLPKLCCHCVFHDQLKHQYITLFFREFLGCFGWQSSLPYLSPAEGQEDGCSPPSSFCMLQQEWTLHCEYLGRQSTQQSSDRAGGNFISVCSESTEGLLYLIFLCSVASRRKASAPFFLRRRQLVL